MGAAIPDAPAAGRHRRFLDRLGLHALEVGVEALVATGLRPGDPRLDRAGLDVPWFALVPNRDQWTDRRLPHDTPF